MCVPLIIKKCLSLGIKIDEHKIEDIVNMSKSYPIDPEILKNIDKEILQIYIDMLYLKTTYYKDDFQIKKNEITDKLLKYLIDKNILNNPQNSVKTIVNKFEKLLEFDGYYEIDFYDKNIHITAECMKRNGL